MRRAVNSLIGNPQGYLSHSAAAMPNGGEYAGFTSSPVGSIVPTSAARWLRCDLPCAWRNSRGLTEGADCSYFHMCHKAHMQPPQDGALFAQ